MADETGLITLQGEAVLFGFPSTPSVLRIQPRPASWRLTGAALIMAAFIPLAAVVAIVPPHAPWLIGALAGGAILARRRWIERFTLMSAEGTCPKCGEPLVARRSRLRVPHPVMCESCHHESSLSFERAALAA